MSYSSIPFHLKFPFLHIIKYIDVNSVGTSLKKLPFCPSSNITPSRDAVDDQFQHTYDALAGIMSARPIARPIA